MRVLSISRRDPLDTCFSCFSKLFVDGLPYTYDLGELGRYYRAYEALMAHWREVLPEGAMLEVQYEELVADLEGQCPAHDRLLRSGVGRALPRISQNRAAGADGQQDPGAAAALQEFGWAGASI